MVHLLDGCVESLSHLSVADCAEVEETELDHRYDRKDKQTIEEAAQPGKVVDLGDVLVRAVDRI